MQVQGDRNSYAVKRYVLRRCDPKVISVPTTPGMPQKPDGTGHYGAVRILDDEGPARTSQQTLAGGFCKIQPYAINLNPLFQLYVALIGGLDGACTVRVAEPCIEV